MPRQKCRRSLKQVRPDMLRVGRLLMRLSRSSALTIPGSCKDMRS